MYAFCYWKTSQEIESQYKLINMPLAEPEKYKEAIYSIKEDIAYMPWELKKKLEEDNITLWMKRKQHLSWSVIFKNHLLAILIN